MAQLILPQSRRSVTAVADKSDLRDEWVYSAIVAGYGGTGQQTAFTVPKGQNIPRLVGSSIAPTSSHQLTYADGTTNITQAGQLGSALGDASIRGIGITVEQVGYNDTTGVANAYGAGPLEQAEIASKLHFRLRIAGKDQIQGPTILFPSFGALFGSSFASTTAAATTMFGGVISNGWPSSGKRLKVPIMVGRTDTLEGFLTVSGSSTLNFTTSTGQGNCSLVWVTLMTLLKGDVR